MGERRPLRFEKYVGGGIEAGVMKIAFIGLGKMGKAMAGRLLSAGHDLALFNRTSGKCDSLVSQGAKRVATIAEAARHGEVVVTMLENDEALRDVSVGGGGLLSSMMKRSIHVAMGTHGVSLIEELTAAHAKAGHGFLSAPVLGRPSAAEAGLLMIIVAGEPATVKTCQPLFDAMGRHTFDGGPEPKAAAAAKIVNNFILACAIQSLGEGFALGRKCGIPAVSLLKILTNGLFSGSAHKIYGKIIAENNYFGEPGFTANTGLKDLGLAIAASEAVSVPLPSAVVCRDRLLSAIANGNGNSDWSVMALEQARASGIQSPPGAR
jgi:3-hydroxyisobutyrate dehydrogenase-like beta-hydroxyacid dehydrogenase